MATQRKNYYDEPEEESEATALLPKSILMGKEGKVGDTITLKITAIHEDEVQVERAGASKPAEEEPEEEVAPATETEVEPAAPSESPGEGDYE